MKTAQCTLVSVALFLLFGSGISCASDGPPVPPRIGEPIDYYKFKDTNWNSAHGFAPRSFSGIEGVTGWGTNLAMRISGSGPAWLQYNYIDVGTNGSQTNLTFPEGALTFWVRPLWSGTNIEGGAGPGVPARLIELGAFTEQQNWGWFSLFLDEDGTTLSLGVQSNQYTAVPIQAPITWESNTWHFVSLNYTLDSLQLYLDGQLAASATNGLPFWPNDGVLATNGIFIGSDSSGSNLANADFAYIRTYDYAIMDDLIASQYNRVATNYLQENMGMNMFAGIGFQFWEYAMESGTNGLALSIALEETNAILTVSGGESGILYDLYYATNLLGSNATESAWTWLSSVSSGQSYLLYNQPSPIYYMLGTPLDSDSDGLPDAFEMLVCHSQTNNTDTDADGLPDGWEWRNFVSFAQTASGDYDQDGASNLQEYQQHSDPNTITFSPRLGNRYFHVTNAAGTCEVFKGAAAYWAVQVGPYSTNCNTWQPYAGQVTLPLGPTNGAYNVWVGLKGGATNSVPAWVGTTVYLDTIAPTVIITNPLAGTVSRPIIQIQGYANEPLSSAVYSITNTAGIQTNEQVFLTTIVGPPNGPLTNNFQCFDLDLEPGTNRIGITVADLAGNETSTTLDYVLDYSSATNPLIEIIWPPEGTPVGGSNTYIMGRIDDETAEVTLSGEGLSYPLPALVERNGTFWIERLTLASMTNEFTLTASNAAGLVTTTNITIIQSSVRLTMNTVPEDQLNNSFVTVSGTVSDPSYNVQVNGIAATVDVNGTWTATNVPVNCGGTAIFTAEANPGGYEGGGYPAPGQGPSSTLSQQQDKPAEVKLVYGKWNYNQSNLITRFSDWGQCDYDYIWNISREFNSTNGATGFAFQEGTALQHVWNFSAYYSELLLYSHNPPAPSYGTIYSYVLSYDGTESYSTNAWMFGSYFGNDWGDDKPWAHGAIKSPYNASRSDTEAMDADVKVVLRTGGKSGIRDQNIIELRATAFARTLPYNFTTYAQSGPAGFSTNPISPTNLSIPQFGKFGPDGKKYLVLPDNQEIDVALSVPGIQYYEFAMEATKITPQITNLQWVTYNSVVDDDLSGFGSPGKRIFPDKSDPTNNTQDLDLVRLQATISPHVAGIQIYFKAFDVDDPSTNNVVDANGNAGGDNAGGAGAFYDSNTSSTSKTTSSQGYATVIYRVGMQPGDNYRVAASCNSSQLTPLNNNNVPTFGSLTNPSVKITPLLTVWRRLWIERDTMAAVTNNSVTVSLTSVTTNVTIDGTSFDAVLLGSTLPDGQDVFEGGTLTISAPSKTLNVFKNTDNLLSSDTVYVPAGSFTANEINFIATNHPIAILHDDDNDLLLPHYPSGGALIFSAFADAYILPVYADAYNTRTNIPFQKNLSDLGVRYDIDDAQDLSSSSDFWCTLVVGCFQPKENEDGDADGISAIVGLTVASDSGIAFGASPAFMLGMGALNTSAIFLETIDDIVRALGTSSTTDEPHTVVHEIGHTAGANGLGHKSEGIMRPSAPRYQNTFDPDSIHHFRTITTW